MSERGGGGADEVRVFGDAHLSERVSRRAFRRFISLVSAAKNVIACGDKIDDFPKTRAGRDGGDDARTRSQAEA